MSFNLVHKMTTVQSNSIQFKNSVPEKYSGRQGDVIFWGFNPLANTQLAKWCEESRQALLEIERNNPLNELYAAMREYTKQHGSVVLAEGEHTHHNHMIPTGSAVMARKIIGDKLFDTSPSKGLNMSLAGLEVLDQMEFPANEQGLRQTMNKELFTDFCIVTAIKPFGLYHINTRGLDSIKFDVEYLKQEDIAEHVPIYLDAGNFLFGIQASVNLQNELRKVID